MIVSHKNFNPMKRIFLLFALVLAGGALFGQYQTVLFQDFNAGVLPAGWSTTTTGPTDPTPGPCGQALFSFDCTDAVGGSGAGTFDGSFVAAIDDDAAGPNDVGVHSILSPVMDLSTGGVDLTFDWQHEAFAGGGNFIVEGWDGSAWQQLFFADDDSQNAGEVVDLSMFTNADFQLRFSYDDEGDWQWGCAFDNVVVRAHQPPQPGGPTCALYCPQQIDYNLASGECSHVAEFPGLVNMVGTCPPTVVPGQTLADFTGAFAAPSATQNTNCVDLSGVPATISLESVDLAAPCDPSIFFATYAEYVIPFDGMLTFDWNYTTADVSAFWDPFGYFFDASNTFLSLGAIQAGITELTDPFTADQNGSASVPVSAGDLFSFMIYTQDGIAGSAQVTISNLVLQAPDQVSVYQILPQPGTPAQGDDLPIGSYTAGYQLLDPTGQVIDSCSFQVNVIEHPATNNLQCVQDIQISLDENCQKVLTAADILQGNNYGCFDNYVVNIISNTGAPLGNVADGSMTGSTWTVMVTDTSVNPTNSCWAQGITFADKTPPTITCEATTPTTSFQGTLEATDPSLNLAANGAPCWTGVTAFLDNDHNYDVYTFTVTVAGQYTFDMSGLGDGLAALFNAPFDPANPCNGFIAGDDDGGPGLDPQITVNLTPGDYAFVATNTSFGSFLGDYTVTITGPAPVQVTSTEITVDCTFDLSSIPDPVGADNCDPNPDEQLVSETYLDDQMCDDGKMVLQRVWIAIDNQGMQSAPCTQTITVIQPQLTFPEDITWTCDQYAAHNNIVDPTPLHPAITDWDPNDNQGDIDANPGLSNYILSNTGSGVPSGYQGTYCNYNVEHSDQVFDHCGPGTFKIHRLWTVTNMCTNQIVTHTQLIVVDDIDAPTMDFTNLAAFQTNNAGGIYLEVSANQYASGYQYCTSTEFIPTPAFSDNCSGVDMSTLSIITPIGEVTGLGPNGGFIPAPGLPVGVYPDGLTYKIADNCGNIREVKITLIVKDDIPPVMVCQETTKVSLTSNGEGKLFAQSSVTADSYDNCGIDHFEVRRVSDNCNIIGNTTFDNSDDNGDGQLEPGDSYIDPDQGAYVTFCCEDVNATHTVVFRGYDVYGNYSDCTVDVLVEDAQAPQCFAPADVTVPCYEFDPTLWPYGDATGADNCDFTITGPVVSGSVDNCNSTDSDGSDNPILRTWTITDASGLTSTCTQKISVHYVQNFKVKFPNDQFDSDCGALSDTLFPSFIDRDCELAGYSYYDEVIDVVPDACYKILRHWTIYDWCDFDLNYTPTPVQNPTYTVVGPMVQANANNHGYFTYTQIIKVLDNDPPVITGPASPLQVCDYTTNCSGDAYMTAIATDDCSKSDLEFNYTLYLDLDGDGTMETVVNSTDPGAKPILTAVVGDSLKATVHYPGMPYGTHKIKWVVFDHCGQSATYEYNIEVKDCKKPTIVVDNGAAVNLMNVSGGMVTVWVGDPANCGLPQPNVCAWDPSVGDNCTPDDELKIRIRKAGAGVGVPTTTSVTYTCADLGTNNVEIWVGDNAGNWDYTVTYVVVEDNMGVCTGPLAPVSGALTTEDDQGVGDADVTAAPANGNTPPDVVTSASSGDYTFTGLPLNQDYTVTPIKDGDDQNGVNVLDLLRIYQAILGSQPFTSPYQSLAADVTQDGQVNISDLLVIRQLTLGKISEFPNTTSWRFYEAACDASTSTCNEFIDITNLQGPINNADFVAVKMGDVTGDAAPNVYASVDNRTYGEFVINTADQVLHAGDVAEIKLTGNRDDIVAYQFTLNFDGMEFVDVTGKDISFDNNFALHDNALTVSWIGTPSEEVFTLKVRATRDVRLSNALTLNGRITDAMAFNTDELKQDVKLAFDGKVVDQFTLFQNVPNPFSDRTEIKFYLPEAASATLTVFDANGRVLKTIKGDYAKGMNTVSIAKSDLGAAGVMLYKLETAEHAAMKKMIIME